MGENFLIKSAGRRNKVQDNGIEPIIFRVRLSEADYSAAR